MEQNQLYNDLNTYLKKRFGCKVYKVALNAKVTCPNRDGTLGTRGCIFCSRGGSGDFASPVELSITEQIRFGCEKLKQKLAGQYESTKFIAYFQSFTNTYASIDYLRSIYTEAISNEDVCAISIATRPDCISDEVLKLLVEINNVKPVWVELGLQTMHDTSVEYIRRGYPNETYEACIHRLNSAGLEVIVHLILGLPGEDEEMMLESARYVCKTGNVQGVKLQLLHVMADTDLGEEFIKAGDNAPEKLRLNIQTLEDYIDILAKIIRELPNNIVVHRITGDAPHDKLLFPKWSGNKRIVLNGLRKKLREPVV